MTVKFGVDVLLRDSKLLAYLHNKRVGLVAHPASVTPQLSHSMSELLAAGVNIRVAFGPQHGLRGDKQDNMIESSDFVDERQIPVISLYGEHRYPTDAMMQQFDVLLFDLQDLGCRIYTYITTLYYFIEACDRADKELWILDRPNPAGREIDGMTLLPGHESFVGCDQFPMRHGLTLGEFALWVVDKHKLALNLRLIAMQNYLPDQAPGYGWPSGERVWVNPSPNAAGLNMARCYPGTVLVEGTTLSEGRGTTRPLELIGAPDLHIPDLLSLMQSLAPHWMEGVIIRPCFFEPTFHKHQGALCQGVQIHTDAPDYEPVKFKPYRLVSLFLKAIRLLHPGYNLWRDHTYEYTRGRLPIDVINGGAGLREWVDCAEATVDDLEQQLILEQNAWSEIRTPYLIYP